MESIFTPYDRRDVAVRVLGFDGHRGDNQVFLAQVSDGTEAETVEITCTLVGSTTAQTDPASLEAALAGYINRVWQPEARLEAVRGGAEVGGEYAVSGYADTGLRVTEPRIAVAR